MKLKNHDAIQDELSRILMNLEVRRCDYETDIYLYVDDEGNGSLDEFPNPGGNSWRNDDHITIWTDEGGWVTLEDFDLTFDEDGNYDPDELKEKVEDMKDQFDQLADDILSDYESEDEFGHGLNARMKWCLNHGGLF